MTLFLKEVGTKIQVFVFLSYIIQFTKEKRGKNNNYLLVYFKLIFKDPENIKETWPDLIWVLVASGIFKEKHGERKLSFFLSINRSEKSVGL